MLKQTHDVKLKTNDENLKLNLLNIRKVTDNSYQSVIEVHSRGFTCKYRFYLSESYLVKAIDNLKIMRRSFMGEAVLSEDYGLSEVTIKINELGQITVSGIITETSGFDQKLEFDFSTDQTVLQPLIDDLEQVRILPLSSDEV